MPVPPLRPILLTALFPALLAGCAFGDADLVDVDPDAVPAAPTWSAHVGPIMQRHCVACHDPDGQAGAAEGYAYDTCQSTRREWDELEETVFEEGSMPPGGAMRLESWEIATLDRWYAQGARCD